MKNKFLLPLVIIVSHTVFAQKYISKIDSLNSNKEIENLINSILPIYHQNFSLIPITEYKSRKKTNYWNKIADSLNITKSYYKSDFDHNGYTDLMVIGVWSGFQIYVIMNYANNFYELRSLHRKDFSECTYPLLINDSIIRYYHIPEPDWKSKNLTTSLVSIDLVYKFGDFIEFQDQSKKYNIEKIEYQTNICPGMCPVFYISIDKNKSSIYDANDYYPESRDTNNRIGLCHTTLRDSSFYEIIDLLNYIDFPNLKDDYSMSATHEPSSTLTITYNNGNVKVINDYGLLGTYGLSRLYQLLFDLRFNQNWM